MNPLSDFLSMARECGPQRRYYPRAALYLIKLAAFEPFRLAEARRAKPPGTLPNPPVFILGYYRSGTTHLQEVMLTDPQFAYMDFYQGFFPTAFNSTERFVKPLFEAIITRTGFRHPAHGIPFSFDLPAEEDVALVASAYRLAPNWGQVFQRHFKRLYGRTALMDGTPEEIADFRATLHDLIWRVSKSRGHQRLLLKSPPHTGRLGLLRKMYPGARFVFIRRHPYDTYCSNLKLWKSFDDQRMQAISAAEVDENIFWSHDRAHANYERDKVGLAADQLVEVTFEDFVDAPMAVLEQIYEQLELGDFRQVAPGFRAYLAENHAPPPLYTLAPGKQAQIDARLGHWMARWGYADTPRQAAG